MHFCTRNNWKPWNQGFQSCLTLVSRFSGLPSCLSLDVLINKVLQQNNACRGKLTGATNICACFRNFDPKIMFYTHETRSMWAGGYMGKVSPRLNSQTQRTLEGFVVDVVRPAGVGIDHSTGRSRRRRAGEFLTSRLGPEKDGIGGQRTRQRRLIKGLGIRVDEARILGICK